MLHLFSSWRHTHIFKASGDATFIVSILPEIRAALEWILTYGDSNGDGFIDYRFHPGPSTHGGLTVQSWMDSRESIFYEDSNQEPP